MFSFFAAQLDRQQPDRHRPSMAGMLAPARDEFSSIDVIAARHRVVFYGNLPNTQIPGLATDTHQDLRINDGTVIQGNAGHGIRVESASEAEVGSLFINNNGGDGISIGDLSFVWFRGASNITGSLSSIDVVCRPQFSATRGTVGDLGGGKTNCLEP